jgi:hypothetical protein
MKNPSEKWLFKTSGIIMCSSISRYETPFSLPDKKCKGPMLCLDIQDQTDTDVLPLRRIFCTYSGKKRDLRGLYTRCILLEKDWIQLSSVNRTELHSATVQFIWLWAKETLSRIWLVDNAGLRAATRLWRDASLNIFLTVCSVTCERNKLLSL